MLVEVVPLRFVGDPIPKDRLAQPVRGHLLLQRSMSGDGYTATIQRSYPEGYKHGYDVLSPLMDARVTRIYEDSIIVAGFLIVVEKDDEGEWRHRRGPRQSWWCKAVNDPAREPQPPSDPTQLFRPYGSASTRTE